MRHGDKADFMTRESGTGTEEKERERDGEKQSPGKVDSGTVDRGYFMTPGIGMSNSLCHRNTGASFQLRFISEFTPGLCPP